MSPRLTARLVLFRTVAMAVLLENAYELITIAREIRAIPLKGHPRSPSDIGGWTLSVLPPQGAEALGELDLDEYPSPSVTQQNPAIPSWSASASLMQSSLLSAPSSRRR
jgi:hypothetical protein